MAEFEQKITLHVSPRIGLKFLLSDPVSRMVYQKEANMLAEALVSEGIVAYSEESSVGFNNDDLGEGVSYPFVKVGKKCYEVELDKNS